MVPTHRLLAVVATACWQHHVGRLAATVLTCLTIAMSALAMSALAQQPNVHYQHSGDMPPGAIGQRQLLRGGPLPGYFQPVEISAPDGVMISLTAAGTFEPPQHRRRRAAFLIGQVYRLKVTNIPLQPGVEVFPTVEVIDRTYPPLGQEFRFPIPVQISRDDLVQAAGGKMVTRVIYLEDPLNAVPIAQEGDQQAAFDAAEGEDPLRVADALGRPVAILRLGARIPGPQGPDARFLFGSPPWIPAEQIPAEQIPAKQIPAKQIPAKQIPAKQIPAEQIPAAEFTQPPAGAAIYPETR